jgi:predicted nucleic acid-binding protein
VSAATSTRVAASRRRGLLDTSVVIALEGLPLDVLPEEPAISSPTLTELTAGPHATTDPAERARRQDRLQRTEAAFDPLPFDLASARAHGRILAAVVEDGRTPRARRAIDLMVAATALAYGLPLYTRDPVDLRGLEDLVEIVDLTSA